MRSKIVKETSAAVGRVEAWQPNRVPSGAIAPREYPGALPRRHKVVRRDFLGGVAQR